MHSSDSWSRWRRSRRGWAGLARRAGFASTCVADYASAGLVLTAILTAILLLTGCGGARVVIVDPNHEVVRAGPDMRGKVYTQTEDGGWELSRNRVHITEGFWILWDDEADRLPGDPP